MNAARNLARTARQEVKENRLHIQLRDIPKAALLSDIRRCVAQARLEGIADVAIDYRRFQPTGRAWLTLTHPDFLQPNLSRLASMRISSLPIRAFPAPPPDNIVPKRTRGAEGRKQAMERGLMDGNGPHAGVRSGRGRNVVVWGLPGRMTTDLLRMLLKNYRLSGSGDATQEVFKVGKPGSQFTLFSRFLIRLDSVSEAYRLVRRLHMTYFQPEKHDKKYHIRARVVH